MGPAVNAPRKNPRGKEKQQREIAVLYRAEQPQKRAAHEYASPISSEP